MNNCNTFSVEQVIHNLKAAEDDMNFRDAAAVASSVPYLQRHLAEHDGQGRWLDSAMLVSLATARHEWLLQQMRPTLSGIFTDDDIVVMLNCYQGDRLGPDEIHNLASFVCDDNGIELGEYQNSGLASLVNKVNALNSPQLVALADALEQTWNRGLRSGQSVSNFLATLGIALVD